MNRQKTEQILETYIFPLALLLFPLLWINQGIDVSDPMYSLTNFRFFPTLTGGWQVATYLANVLGYLLTCLPWGHTLLGMNLYTGLAVSGMALLSYYFLRGKMPAWIAFLGEIIAVCFCWCPTIILYNYLTYFLFLGGCILLYRGLIWDKKIFLFCAGICLGLNVCVRTPNVVETVLIAAVFYYGRLKKKAMREVWKQTGLCVGGYLAGFLTGFLAIMLQYGPDAYLETLLGLGGYQSTDASYSPLSMVTSILAAYGGTLYWVLVMLFCTFAGMLFIRMLPERFKKAGNVLFCLCLPLLLRLLWGRGVFTFEYSYYRSIYEWGMVFLYLTIGFAVFCLGSERICRRDKLLSFIVLLGFIAIPIGSNNGTMPSLNFLFLAAPFTLWMAERFVRRFRYRTAAFPAMAMLVMIFGMTLAQGLGFRSHFAFGDGIDGQKRDAKVENSVILQNMETTPANAAELSGLVDFWQKVSQAERELITFGNAPGLHFILEMHPALQHTWPDLDTYGPNLMEEELHSLEEELKYPVIIVRKEDGRFPDEAEKSGDGSAVRDEKWDLLRAYMEREQYETVYENEGYAVLETAKQH